VAGETPAARATFLILTVISFGRFRNRSQPILHCKAKKRKNIYQF